MKWIVEKIVKPIFIVNEYGELGVRVFGVNCYYYKRETPLFYGTHDNEPRWRHIFKREFGECVISKFDFDGNVKNETR